MCDLGRVSDECYDVNPPSEKLETQSKTGAAMLEGCMGDEPHNSNRRQRACHAAQAKPEIQYVRLVTRESNTPSSWKEITVIGKAAGKDARNVIDTGEARVEVSSGGASASSLIDDDEATFWTPDTHGHGHD